MRLPSFSLQLSLRKRCKGEEGWIKKRCSLFLRTSPLPAHLAGHRTSSPRRDKEQRAKCRIANSYFPNNFVKNWGGKCALPILSELRFTIPRSRSRGASLQRVPKLLTRQYVIALLVAVGHHSPYKGKNIANITHLKAEVQIMTTYSSLPNISLLNILRGVQLSIALMRFTKQTKEDSF